MGPSILAETMRRPSSRRIPGICRGRAGPSQARWRPQESFVSRYPPTAPFYPPPPGHPTSAPRYLNGARRGRFGIPWIEGTTCSALSSRLVQTNVLGAVAFDWETCRLLSTVVRLSAQRWHDPSSRQRQGLYRMQQSVIVRFRQSIHQAAFADNKSFRSRGIALHEHNLIIMPSNYPPTDGVDLRLYVMDKLIFRVTNVECHNSPMVWSGVTHIGHRYDGQPLIGAGYWLANRSEVGMNTR